MLLSHISRDVGSILTARNYFSPAFYFRLGGQELELIIRVGDIFVLAH
jgi:hypothetical protein